MATRTMTPRREKYRDRRRAGRCPETRRAVSRIYEEALESVVYPLPWMRVTFRRVAAATLILLGAGCDPILNVEGSFFPAWMVAMVIGIALTVVVRYLFVLARLEPHLGPPLLIYTSLGLLLTLVSWLVLYRT